MTVDENTIGRLLCIGIRGSEPGEPILESDLEACAAAGVRAVILFDVDVPGMLRLRSEGMSAEDAAAQSPRNIRSPEQLRCLTSHIRSRLGDDTLICVDQEGGATSRLGLEQGFKPGVSAIEFAAMSQTEQQANALIQASQLSDAGINFNLAPCVDLAMEPESSIIARLGRSFGDDPEVVTVCARAIIAAHTSRGIGTCLKHFPGHGSARGDTHKRLVDITDTARPDHELLPYRDLLATGQDSVAVMVAHVLDRRVDSELPASLSPRFIEGSLRGELGFDGLVATDSIDMAAIEDAWSPGDAAVRAIMAGADLVIDGFNLNPSRMEHPALPLMTSIRNAIEDGSLSAERVSKSLSRIDRFRRALSLSTTTPQKK